MITLSKPTGTNFVLWLDLLYNIILSLHQYQTNIKKYYFKCEWQPSLMGNDCEFDDERFILPKLIAVNLFHRIHHKKWLKSKDYQEVSMEMLTLWIRMEWTLRHKGAEKHIHILYSNVAKWTAEKSFWLSVVFGDYLHVLTFGAIFRS